MGQNDDRANEIDLLRFFAAVAVVFFHYAYIGAGVTGARTLYPTLSAAAQYGYLGVDLFFLISGFVIMMSASHGTVSAFLASRVSRLYPAFWVCCTATFVTLLLTGSKELGVRQYVANMTLIGTAAPVPLVDASYWSLAAEIRFYALVGILLAVRQIRRAELWILLWLVVAVASAVVPMRLVEIVLVTKYAAYFIAGATFYFVWDRGLTPRRAVVLIACLALAEYRAVQFAHSLALRDGVAFSHVVVAIIVACCFAVLLLIALRKTGPIGRGRWLRIGALTYPLYLLHQAAGLALFRLWNGKVDPHVLFWSMIALMIFCAWLVNTYIEDRFARRFRKAIVGLFDRPRLEVTSAPLP